MFHRTENAESLRRHRAQCLWGRARAEPGELTHWPSREGEGASLRAKVWWQESTVLDQPGQQWRGWAAVGSRGRLAEELGLGLSDNAKMWQFCELWSDRERVPSTDVDRKPSRGRQPRARERLAGLMAHSQASRCSPHPALSICTRSPEGAGVAKLKLRNRATSSSSRIS